MSDIAESHPDESEKETAEQKLALLTPILKAFLTEVGFESANLGLQCFGGHGYINEWGMEQNVRDARIAMLYEGTTGIQALDLLGRKVLGSRLGLVKTFSEEIASFCKEHARTEGGVKHQAKKLSELNKEWASLSKKIGLKAMRNKEIVGSASVDYLMYSGYICVGYFLARSAAAAQKELEAGATDKDFLNAKLETAEFYFRRILPRTLTLAKTMLDDPEVLLQMEEERFSAYI